MNTRTTGTDPGSKSAAEIEREVQESRADLEHTLDAIQERFSPGQLVDQALGYFRGGRGVDFARNLGDSITANPVPLALMGVGLAWMMMSGQRSARGADRADLGYEGPEYWDEDLDPAEAHYGSFAEEDMAYLGPEADTGGGFGEGVKERGRSAKDRMGGYGEGVKEAGRSAKDRMGEVGDRARGAAAQARNAASHARERAREAGAHARDRFGRARAGMAGSAENARERAGYYGRRAKRGMLRSLDEQPLVLGAIGLAIGAALGAALPPTRTEDELMGETRDDALRRATSAGREQAGKLREAAGAVAAAAREEAGKQGLAPENSGKPGQEAGKQRPASESSGKAGQTTSTGSGGQPERREDRPAGIAGDTPLASPKPTPDRT